MTKYFQVKSLIGWARSSLRGSPRRRLDIWDILIVTGNKIQVRLSVRHYIWFQSFHLSLAWPILLVDHFAAGPVTLVLNFIVRRSCANGPFMVLSYWLYLYANKSYNERLGDNILNGMQMPPWYRVKFQISHCEIDIANSPMLIYAELLLLIRIRNMHPTPHPNFPGCKAAVKCEPIPGRLLA